jgi:hypothetical protein
VICGVAHSTRYFNQYGLDNVYLPSPEHSKYISEDVLKRFIPVGGVRIEDDILVGCQLRYDEADLRRLPQMVLST